MIALEYFHPAVRDWFLKRFPAPTGPQAEAWPAIKEGKHTLIAAPTGSGKTLAAFLSAIDDLVWKATEGTLSDETQVVYVSPLKALSNDIQINLQEPLRGIQQNLEAAGVKGIEIRTLVRTGDTPAKDRAAMTKKPPHIIVTTPESLYILLTSDGGRRILSTTRTLIVDEIHAIVDDKRGSHLSLSIERLQALVAHGYAGLRPATGETEAGGTPAYPQLVRIGLSATQKPIEEVARFLVGTSNIAADGSPRCTIIDSGHARKLDLAIEVPNSPLEALMSNEVWEEIYDRIANLIREHKTTLVFVNTRRMAERVARHLGERLGDENVTSHHGSLARELRLSAEQRLKSGELSALVATASLELGIDIGAVDLVIQIGSTRAISTLLQRIGRSNHTVSGFPKGRVFPLSRDELVECAALLDAVRRGELDHLEIPEQPLDILAQQIVAAVAPEEWTEDALFEMVRRAYPFRNLKRERFDEVVRMLSEGFTTRRGRRGTYLHQDAVNHRLRGRRGARLMSITNGGAIPDTSDYRVILEPSETFVGTLNEDFAIESLAGDIFQLGNSSYEIKRVGAGEVRVLDAHGQPPSIPFWLGEAPGRSEELSQSVSRLRAEIAHRLDESGTDSSLSDSAKGQGAEEVITDLSLCHETALDYLVRDVGLSHGAAAQIVEYLAMTKIALGAMPTQEQIVVERFFDENGSTHVVIHAPFGSRLNRAWGLALRKRFCRTFNFELQAAATEDSIVLSLGPTHSFPLETIFNYLNSKGVSDVLTQALLNAPMFNIRWRWNATRALAIPRWRSGGKVAPQLQRMAADDLLALVFPDQLACAENLTGPIEVPAHPLVEQTVRDCLEEAMDIHGLEALLQSIERGERTLIAREMNEPSPLAQEILTAKPYAFLDDAPAEERRTLAVMNRRFLDAETAADLGRLDQAAIDRVREEAWPQAENADELHDALMQLGFITVDEGQRNGWRGLFEELLRDSRATVLIPQPQREQRFSPSNAEEVSDSATSAQTSAFSAVGLWVAAERLNQLRAIYPAAELDPHIDPPSIYASEEWEFENALVEVLRGRLEGLGPVAVAQLANSFSLSKDQIEQALAKLEGEGFAMQGQFTPGERGRNSTDVRGSSPTVREGPEEITGKDASEPPAEMRALQLTPALQEWCSRRLLARIHSYTLNRLRKEIEPVSAADFMRFLFVWHKVAPDHKVEGAQSVAAILDQLEGFEAPAGSWESEILPARIADYDPAWLDALCLSGRLTWLRLSPPKLSAEKTNSSSPVRSTPVVLLNRKNVAPWSKAFPARENGAHLSTNTQTVYDYLKEHGASFFVDIVSGTNLLASMVEEGLGELVFRGLISSDSFTGLRALLTPLSKTTNREIEKRRRRRKPVYSMDEAGRWVRLGAHASGVQHAGGMRTEAIETVALKLLQRYGVVFRKLLDRESISIPWRDLLRVFRRLEARGEIRGGRFVGGFSGEQFASADAVQLLRSIRRTPNEGMMISLSAADPLNLLGVIVPGGRLAPAASNRVLYRDGVPIAILEAKELRLLIEMSAADQWQARNALLRRHVPPKVRAYLNQTGRTVSPPQISSLTH